MSDISVFGLIMTTVHIGDISMDVAPGSTVVIPAAKANFSKDLWRLIAQKQLFKLGTGPLPDTRPSTPPTVETAQLREENRLLLEQNALLRQSLTSHDGKLDTILGLLAQGVGVGVPEAPGEAPRASSKPVSDVVEIEVPTYIPSEIKPRGVESHVEVKSETTEGAGVSGAGAALRKLRQQAR